MAGRHRDRRIVELALAKLLPGRVDFDDAMPALREATDELIPNGSVFLLGMADAAPIVCSLVSGVGIVEREAGIQLVHARGSDVTPLGWFTG